MIGYNEIPEDVLNEIDFMLGSIEECNSDYLEPILKAHGYEVNGSFLGFTPEDDKELTLDIYKTLFVEAGFKSFTE